MPVTILRLFGSYGPGQNRTWWGGPQSVFIDAALRGQEMDVHGDGQQTRSFTYVDDTVDGLVRAMFSPRAVGEIFNVGNTKPVTSPTRAPSDVENPYSAIHASLKIFER